MDDLLSISVGSEIWEVTETEWTLPKSCSIILRQLRPRPSVARGGVSAEGELASEGASMERYYEGDIVF